MPAPPSRCTTASGIAVNGGRGRVQCNPVPPSGEPIKRVALAALFFFALTPTRLPAAEPAVTVEKAVTYATVGGDKLQLDIAIPEGKGPFPCVVAFHGGAWQYGSRKDLSGNG